MPFRLQYIEINIPLSLILVSMTFNIKSMIKQQQQMRQSIRQVTIKQAPVTNIQTYKDLIIQLQEKNKSKSQFLNNIMFMHIDQHKINDYIPYIKINTAQDIQRIHHSCTLSARFIYLARIKRTQKVTWPFETVIFTEQNQCYRKFKSLHQNYRERYLKERGLIVSNSSSYYRPNQKQNLLTNYTFYASGQIDAIHSKKGDYSWLEGRHDYIQFMFPNHFQSMFNMRAYPLDYYEVQLFKQSQKVGLKLLKSTHVFFDFMGLELDQNQRIQIVSQKRLENVLLVNWHNHLRLRRILACLSVTGFRHIALQLIAFLNKIIQYNSKYSSLKRALSDWTAYSDENIQQALKLCFHSQKQFPKKHIIYSKKSFQQNSCQRQISLQQNKKNDNKLINQKNLSSKKSDPTYQHYQMQQQLQRKKQQIQDQNQAEKSSQIIKNYIDNQYLNEYNQQQIPIEKSQQILNSIQSKYKIGEIQNKIYQKQLDN